MEYLSFPAKCLFYHHLGALNAPLFSKSFSDTPTWLFKYDTKWYKITCKISDRLEMGLGCQQAFINWIFHVFVRFRTLRGSKSENQLYLSKYDYIGLKISKYWELIGTIALEKVIWSIDFVKISYLVPKEQE